MILSEFLYKKGEKGVVKRWKRRWFYIKEDNPFTVVYKEKETDEKAKGKIYLRGVTNIRAVEDNSRDDFIFIVTTPSSHKDRDYILAATTKDSRDKWISSLQNLVIEANKPRDLHEACKANDTETALKYIPLTKDLNQIFCYVEDCRTYLHISVMNGNYQITESLINAKANVNIKTIKFESGISSEGGKTPLDYATWNKDERIIKLLESNGAERGRTDLSSG